MKTQKAFTIVELLLVLLLVMVIVVFTITIPIFLKDNEPRGKAQSKDVNITFDHEGYTITVKETVTIAPAFGPMVVIEIVVIDDEHYISAMTSYKKVKNPWTKLLVSINRSKCDPNSPIYNYTWKDLEFLKDMARQLKKAEKTINQPFTPELEAEILTSIGKIKK